MKETVKVLGRHITIRSESQDPDYVQGVADHVNVIGERLLKEIPGVKHEQVALMVALELADQYFRKAAESLEEGPPARRRIAEIITKIDRAVAG